MDTERYWIHIHILIHKWSWYRGGTCCIIFTSSETGESRSRKSAACPKWEGEQRNSPRRKGLANCWLAGVRVRDENGCSVGRQPDLRLDQHRAAKPAGYTTLTHTYIYTIHSRHMTSMSSEISPPQRASFSISISTLRRVPPEQGHCGIAPEQGPALIAVCVSAQRCWVSFIKTERGRISCLSCVRTSKRDGWNRII